MKDYLITGAGGFIGTKLLEFLKKKNFKVDGLDNFSSSPKLNNKKYKIYNIDITKKRDLKNIVENYKCIIHLAAIDSRKLFVKNYERSNKVNIYGTQNILDLMKSNQSIIYFSSNMVYGEANNLPFTEKHPLLAFEPYALSKICSESLIKSYAFIKNINYLIIRNFNTFGPGQSPGSLIPTMILQAIKEKKIDVWSPDTIRDFQFIDDCIFNTYSLLKYHDKNLTVNLCTGKPFKMKIIAKKISNFFNCPVYLLNKNKPISHENYGDTKFIKKILNNKLKISNFDQSLNTTSLFYKNLI